MVHNHEWIIIKILKNYKILILSKKGISKLNNWINQLNSFNLKNRVTADYDKSNLYE